MKFISLSMLRKIRLLSVLFLFLFFFIPKTTKLNAQTDCPDPNSYPCNEAWQTASINFDDTEFSGFEDEIYVQGTYEWRNCIMTIGGVPVTVTQIRNINMTCSNSNFFNFHTDFQNTFNGLWEYTELEILNNVLWSNINAIPNCDPPPAVPFYYVEFYTADCGVWLRCSYLFPCSNLTPISQDTRPGDTYECPPPINHNGNFEVDVWHWESCGTTCCIKTYSVCLNYDHNGDMTFNLNISRRQADGSKCTYQGDFRTWDTNTVIDCQDGCQGDQN